MTTYGECDFNGTKSFPLGVLFFRIGNEDCLTLNVFRRDLVTAKAPWMKTVIVFIHGGNFVHYKPKDDG